VFVRVQINQCGSCLDSMSSNDVLPIAVAVLMVTSQVRYLAHITMWRFHSSGGAVIFQMDHDWFLQHSQCILNCPRIIRYVSAITWRKRDKCANEYYLNQSLGGSSPLCALTSIKSQIQTQTNKTYFPLILHLYAAVFFILCQFFIATPHSPPLNRHKTTFCNITM